MERINLNDLTKREAVDFVEVAIKAGVPEDQLKNFIQRGYVPLKWQWEFHAKARLCDKQGGPVKVGVGGARGPGKSHAAFAQVALDDCQRIPGLKALFLRKTGKAAQESFEDLIMRVISKKIKYRLSGSVLHFPNGSRIVLGGFYTEKDIDQYIGIEYDLIVVEELNQLTKKKLDMLLGSMRTSKLNWRPRLYASFNPGGIGHQFVKRMFVIPHRKHKESKTRYIPSTYKSNPYLNEEYIDYLMELKGALGIAWREGDFDVFEGQYFKEWRYGIHVVEPFKIPDEWPRFIWGDYGYAHHSAVYWVAISPKNQLFIYRELYETGLTHAKLAKKIRKMTPDKEKSKIKYCVFDPALRQRDGHSGKSGQETMNLAGLITIMGDNDRITGWNQVREYLAPYKSKGGKVTARLQVFSTCYGLIETLPTLIHSEIIPEDLEKKGADDDPADSVRYGLMQRPRGKKVPKKFDPKKQPPVTLQDKIFREQKMMKKTKDRQKKLANMDEDLGINY